MASGQVVKLGSRADAATDPNERLRIIWGEKLGDQLDALGLTPKRFCRLLEDEGGVEVSLQSVYAWLGGKWAPKPTTQAAIAKVLKVPAHHLFPVAA
jgi:hypothetical protein